MRAGLAFVVLLLLSSHMGGAQGAVPTAPQAAPLKVMLEVVNDPSATAINTYVAQLTSEIQRRWVELLGPKGAGGLPAGQEALLSVTINPDGHASDIKVMHRTQNPAFDQAAHRALTEAAFAPVPAGLPKTDLKLRVHYMVQLYPATPGPQ